MPRGQKRDEGDEDENEDEDKDERRQGVLWGCTAVPPSQAR
jgi:hypothetical protein